jgi:hypothetical protein
MKTNFKVTKYVLVCTLLMTFLSADLFAGHNEGRRSGCKWWKKRFWAEAHLSNGSSFSAGYDRGCDWADVHKFGSCFAPNVWAEAKARADWGGCRGYVKTCDATRGGLQSDLYSKISESGVIDLNANASSGSASNASTAPTCDPNIQDIYFYPDFTANTVTIQKIKLSFQSCINSTMENTWTLSVWSPEDDTIKHEEDTVINPSEVIESFTVTISQGQVSFQGKIMNASDFKVTTQGDFVTVDYIGGDKTIVLPEGTDIENIAVSSIGDIKENEGDLFDEVLRTNSGIIKGFTDMTVSPNPASEKIILGMEITNDVNQLMTKIYSIDGKLVKSIESNNISKGMQSIEVNVSGLPQGTYFVLTYGEGVKVMKKFVKQ